MGNLGWGLGFGLGWIFQLLLWVLIVWLVVSLIRRHYDDGSGKKNDSKGENAMEILKSRYAKGEITKEQFEQMKKDLNA